MHRFFRFLTVVCLAVAAGALPVVGAWANEVSEPPAEDATTGALTVLPAQAEPNSPARTSAIPEPVSLAVFGTGVLLLLRRRRV